MGGVVSSGEWNSIIGGQYIPEEHRIIISNTLFGINSRAKRLAKRIKLNIFDASVHEAAHSIWFKHLKQEEKDSFDNVINRFLDEEVAASKDIIEILDKGYSSQQQLGEKYIESFADIR